MRMIFESEGPNRPSSTANWKISNFWEELETHLKYQNFIKNLISYINQVTLQKQYFTKSEKLLKLKVLFSL